MPPVIRISDNLYARLEQHAKGFDTPASVIERLLDEHEGVDSSKKERLKPVMPKAMPYLVFHPSDEKEFLKKLVANGVSWVFIHKEDGTVESSEWHASRITLESNLRANIWSGRLRDWKEKGIVKAEFFVDPKDLPQ